MTGATMAFRHAYSIVTGTAHPIAPPVRLELTDDGVRGRFHLGQQYEGGPGLVHGGILSLVFDHVLGEAALVGEISHGGTVTATAKALFIRIDAETAAALFPHLAQA